MPPPDQVITPSAIIINITPQGFHRYASEFLRIARSSPSAQGFSPAPYYLYGHALELATKAFLLAKGDPVKRIKMKIAHDLSKAFRRARRRHGLDSLVPVSPQEEAEIAKANAYYKKKGFEYFNTEDALRGYDNLPDLSVLDQLAGRLLTNIEPVCKAC
jgi:hypothetical protein